MNISICTSFLKGSLTLRRVSFLLQSTFHIVLPAPSSQGNSSGWIDWASPCSGFWLKAISSSESLGPFIYSPGNMPGNPYHLFFPCFFLMHLLILGPNLSKRMSTAGQGNKACWPLTCSEQIIEHKGQLHFSVGLPWWLSWWSYLSVT